MTPNRSLLVAAVLATSFSLAPLVTALAQEAESAAVPEAAAPAAAVEGGAEALAGDGTEAAADGVPAEDGGAEAELPQATTTLPHDLTPWGMFQAADVIVQAVMIGLVIASILTWTVWLAKTIELVAARRRARADAAVLLQADTLDDAAGKLGEPRSVGAAFAEAAQAELRQSGPKLPADGIKDRVAERLGRIEAAAGRRMTQGTGVLATIGSTAPFVGLFGTVWGIMNSFIGIAESQTTNLAVVAPGIAEALLATALGLFAAIPAVVIYNVFSRSIGGYRALLGDTSAAVLLLVSRDLDRARAS